MPNSGYALYYPYIHIQNSGWLKCAALFWNGLKRIVPRDVIPNDSDTVATLIDELDFIESVEPSHGYGVSESFSNWLSTYDRHNHRKRDHNGRYYHYNDLNFDEMRSMHRPYSYIHLQKLDRHVAELLISLGYAVPGEHSYETYLRIDNEVASVYMTLLSDAIARDKSLSVVTDELYYYSISLCKRPMRCNKVDTGGHILDIMMPFLVPERIEGLPIQKIINFRNRHDEQRRRFITKTNEFMNQAVGIEDYGTLKSFAKDQSKTIKAELKELGKAYDDVGIRTVYRSISITSLTGITSDFIAHNPAITAGGVVIGAIKAFSDSRTELRALKTNPYSYLLSIRKHLEAETLREKINRFIENPFVP